MLIYSFFVWYRTIDYRDGVDSIDFVMAVVRWLKARTHTEHSLVVRVISVPHTEDNTHRYRMHPCRLKWLGSPIGEYNEED